ncbi:hypothetical protein BpHYR1_028613 [Brachionus plicatilis]|uniref:HAT C-terminal dimerisation domain-containing protein n=1 Tax=Brachionus plicatilis TaxID=10195 RepID=A0A3M7SEW2_BRAPC|nr:hypothetical protein BpHYR1_028613 [Brachionus plicatilis]
MKGNSQNKKYIRGMFTEVTCQFLIFMDDGSITLLFVTNKQNFLVQFMSSFLIRKSKILVYNRLVVRRQELCQIRESGISISKPRLNINSKKTFFMVYELIYCVTATSVTSKNLFSNAGLVRNNQRNRMEPSALYMFFFTQLEKN